MITDELESRLTSVEDRIAQLQREVAAIRAELGAPARRPAPAAPATPRVREPFPSRAPRRAQAPAAPAPAAPARELDLGALLGPKALAWVGGVVTLLGVVFFFILAVNNGWIGPGARVACGGAASAIVFAAGLWLRRRFGETDSSLAAVGAGIAGGYATLAAASVLYDLVSKPLALVCAAALAALALGVALAWRSELVAALGLIGAIAAPALLATQGGLSASGVGFAAIVTATAFAVAVRLRWPWLLVGAAVASAPQVAALVIDAHRLDGGAIGLAIVFGLLYLGAGVAEQIATRDEALEPLPTVLVLLSLALTWLSCELLFGPAGGTAAGGALLVAATVFGTSSIVLRRAQGELSTLLGAIALAVAAVGIASILSGPNLAYVFAAEAAVLALAARTTREPRLELGALGYLVLAAGHALLLDAPPDTLFQAAHHPASGAPALAAAAVAAIVVWRTLDTDWHERGERGVLRFLAPLVTSLRAQRRDLRMTTAVAAAAFAVDAVSLSVLELFEAAWPHGGVTASFHRGHVAVAALWSLAGLAVAVAASRRKLERPRTGAFAWLALTGLEVAAYDGSQLTGLGFFLAFAVVAAALVLAGYLRDVLDPDASLSREAFAIPAGLAFAVASLDAAHGHRAVGLGLLAVAAIAGSLAVPVFGRLRDLSTLLWAPALVLAAVAVPLLVDGTWITFAWAAGAAALAALAVATRDERLLYAALGAVVVTAGAAFVDAPPSQLVIAHRHPADGVLDVLLLCGAVAAFAWAARARALWRSVALWADGVLLVYAASLVILEVAVRVSTASLHTDFQRGHSAVSALWGALGLALLYVGLTRDRRALRYGGFALFGVSLGKLFLYDLSQLSSITRALSFLAVGAVLLLGGFFMQRLSEQLGDRRGPRAYS